MKRLITPLTILLLLALTACGGAKKEDADHVFLYNGTTVSCRGDMAEVVRIIGEPTSLLESPSCAGEGFDRLYSYGGFAVSTIPDGDVQRISRIELRNDTVATPEGAAVGMTRREVEEIYGTGYIEKGFGIEYAGRSSRLIFILRDGKVTGIIYSL